MLQEFSYLAPTTLKDLYALLKKNTGNAMILAGGTDLLVEMHNNWIAPKMLIDIKKIPQLSGIRFSKNEGLVIGGTTTCIELINDKNVQKHYPLLVDAAKRIGSHQLRNRATIGGNLCTASPCADMGCSLLALNARVELGSADGVREIMLRDFFTGPKKTQIHKHEVLQRIIVPVEMAGAKFGMRKLKRIKGHDLALVSVAMACTDKVMRVGVGSCAPTPVVSADLDPKTSVEDIKKAVFKVVSPIDDVRASRDYRLFMTGEYIESIYAEMFSGRGAKR
ncbi:MAG: xanthine dehydrogenase family protein subunit M [Candidatus Rifleibacteriota bacterium]